MKKGKMILIAAIGLIAFATTSCKKCHECHYDKAGAEIELGEYCGDDLEDIEANGYTDTSGTYTVHCHEH
jgi:hypothetical protein